VNDEVSQMRLGKVSVSAARRIDAAVGAAVWHVYGGCGGTPA